MKKRTNVIVIIALVLLFILEIVLIKYDYFAKIDATIYGGISQFINPVNTAIFKFFSFFGSELFIIGLCILVLFLMKEKSRGIGFVFVVFLSVLFNQGLKLMVGRARPDINQLVIENSYSFPSGHTMIITTIIGLFIFYLWRNKKGSHIKKVGVTIGLVIIALLVMVSRIYLGVHYFSDIIGGITAALLLLAIVYYYYSFKYKVPYYKKNNREGSK